MRPISRLAALGAVAAITFAGLASLGSPVAAASVTDIRLNEVNSQGTDWVELHNPTSATVDLAGLLIRDSTENNPYTIPAGTIIPAGGFLVIDAPGLPGLGASDQVRLFQGTELIDETSTWTNHTTPSWGRCPDGTGEFRRTSSPTPGAPNDCATPLVINEVNSDGADFVELFNPSAATVDAGGLVIRDETDNNPHTIPAGTLVAPGGHLVIDSGLPGLGQNDSVRLFEGDVLVDSTTWSGHTSPTWGRCPDGTGAFENTAAATPGSANQCQAVEGADVVVINEVESDGPGDDWIELHNAGTDAIDIGGWTLEDDQPGRDTFTFAVGTVLAAGGFIVVAESTPAVPGIEFGLGRADVVTLKHSGGTVIDEFAWTDHAAVTFGRCPDGTGEFRNTTVETPGAPNACGSPLVINETNSDGTDFVELFNPSADTVDAGGLVIRDSTENNPYTVPAGTTVAAGAHLLIDSGLPGLGGTDSVRLFDGDVLLDETSWTGHQTPSWGRCPDGTGAFTVTEQATPGAPNSCPAVPGQDAIVINEIESNGGTPGDWVELHNTGQIEVDLGGWTLLDDDPTHTPAVIAAGTTIAPGGFHVVEEAVLGFGLGTPDAVNLFAPNGELVDSHSWGPHAPTTLARCPDGTGEFQVSTSSTKGAPNDCSAPLRINEVNSSGDDWVELVNVGTDDVAAGGLTVLDSEDGHVFTIPAGTTVPAGGYLLITGDELGYGLGGADSVRLFDGDELLDSTSWTAHGTPSWGRCPDGNGAFGNTETATPGAPNRCVGELVITPWDGPAGTTPIDPVGLFGGDLSGLDISADDSTLYAVVNGTGELFALDPATGVPLPGWEGGKQLRYPDGTGSPDAEGVTVTANGEVFVGSERNNSASGTSRMSVLLYDPSGPSPLSAVTEWHLNPVLPTLGANQGIETVEWISDADLAAVGFERPGTQLTALAEPVDDHFGGLFLVGLEGDGQVYVFELFTDGTFALLTSIDPGLGGVMALDWSADEGILRAFCDEVCDGRHAELTIVDGEFMPSRMVARIADTENIANEGVAIGNVCVDSLRAVWFADDNNTGGHSVRVGHLHCVPGDDDGEPEPSAAPTPTATSTPSVTPSPTTTATATPGATASTTATTSPTAPPVRPGLPSTGH